MSLPTLEQQNKCYDNTKISTYKNCPRSYLIRHVLGWRAEGTGAALIFGLSWHDAQDIVWGHAKKFNQRDLTDLSYMAFCKTWEENGLSVGLTLEQANWMAPRTPQIAHEMLHNYIHARWNMLQGCEIIGIETPFAVPIPGLTGHWYIGRLDKTVGWNAQNLILEHKTTTAYATVGNFRTDYVESWHMSAQVMGYEFGGHLYYNNIDGIWVDAALVHKKVHDAFKFIPVSHSLPIIQEWLADTTAWVEVISNEEEDFKSCDNGLLPGMFKKNHESCYGKFGACPFLDICRSIPDPTKLSEPPPGYVKEVWEPFSILGLDKVLQHDKENNDA
jgi:hypothetical protein